jgi:hypothetical protein
VPTSQDFSHSLKLDVVTAESGNDADELYCFIYYWEGQDLQHLQYGQSSAKDMEFAFWFKSDTKTGTFCVSFRTLKAGGDRYFVHEFTCSDNNWNKYTLTIPGDTAGEILDDNTAGLGMFFIFQNGINFDSSTLDAWSTSASFGSAGQDNFLDHSDNNCWITGMQLEVTSVLGEFPHRSFGEELALCQRYYQKSYPYDVAPGTAEGSVEGRVFWRWGHAVTASMAWTVYFPVPFCDAPTAVIYTLNGTSAQVYFSGSGNTAGATASLSDMQMSVTADASGDSYVLFKWEAEAEL